MAESFSSPGAGPSKTNSNQADRLCHPHPTTPSSGPGYDKDNFQVNELFGSILTPEYERALEYGDDNDDSEYSPQMPPSSTTR